jgi:hypothetical protein
MQMLTKWGWVWLWAKGTWSLICRLGRYMCRMDGGMVLIMHA